MPEAPHLRLTTATLRDAVMTLCERDTQLASVIEQHGHPPLWARRPGFATLIHIILEQQVSLTSAHAVLKKLAEYVGGITPRSVSAVSEQGLHAIGLTRQKASYCHGLAHRIVTGGLSLSSLSRLDDRTAHQTLVQIRGIGPWTADIYLLMALGRPDVWPDGDLALAESARAVKCLGARPDVAELRTIAECWRPWRSVAARILWHAYLSRPRNKTRR